jgi:hypothetical protein
MKRVFCLITFFLSISVCSAQNFTIKGHVFVWSKNGSYNYSTNLGVEMRFINRFSAQMLLGAKGLPAFGGDGESWARFIFAPEFRYYAIEKKNFTTFIGLFGENMAEHWSAGGECFTCISTKEKQTNVGVLVGSQLLIKKHWGIEIFAGSKLGSSKKTETISGIGGFLQTTTAKWFYGNRWGANLIYRFTIS